MPIMALKRLRRSSVLKRCSEGALTQLMSQQVYQQVGAAVTVKPRRSEENAHRKTALILFTINDSSKGNVCFRIVYICR